MPKTVLVVEDSQDDVFFVTRAFKSVGLAAPISIAEDGRKARDYLSGEGSYSDRAGFPIPSVVLLDIRMPFMSGFEVLSWIREQSSFRTLPVIMFSSSDQECDVERAYALGANAFLVKPTRVEAYPQLASVIKQFWIDANIPPPRSSSAGLKSAVVSLPVTQPKN
jgi:CheY-like chemotaxis protein